MNPKQFYMGKAIRATAVLGILFGAVYFFAPTHTLSTSYNPAGPEQHMAAILACYPKDAAGSASQPIPNNSIQYVKETSRVFVNMPKDLYPQDLQSSWTTVAGNATAGSAGGGFGESVAATPNCWSSYADFEGSGEVDLRVKSVVEGVPDYFVRFIISPV
ncbi:MAG: hypothetical protein ACYC4I_02605 [Minisyncoccota bacterium]